MLRSSSHLPRTYSHRRRRANTVLSSRGINADSSPLKNAYGEKGGINTAEPSRERPFIDAANEEDSSSPEMPRNVQTVLPLKTLGDQGGYETPYISSPRDPSAVATESRNGGADTLSPVPSSRLVAIRTGSRNLKENFSRDSFLGLESPFNSRPGSRAASPSFSSQGPTKRLRLHVKSRTLSTDIGAHSQIPVASPDNAASTALQTKSQLINHSRTASIPTMPSMTADQINLQDWFVPPKTLARSPGSNDALQNEHPSFYFNVPDAVSTPARQIRHNTSIYTGDSLDLDGNSVIGGPAPAIGPKCPPRRRRKTIMQAPDDSLFSSILDFSAYITDEESPTRIRKSRGPSLLLDGLSQDHANELRHSEPIAAGLGSAFSPGPAASLGLETLNAGLSAVRQMHGTRSPNGRSLVPLFASMVISNDIVSDVGLVASSHPPTNPGHRRQRADTIRASDFARPLPPDASASDHDVLPSISGGDVKEQLKPGPSRTSRRMRSGTITRADVHDAPAPSSPGIIERILPLPKPPKHKRRREALPQFKRTILDKPLTPQGSDESDDELLLTGEPWTDRMPTDNAE